MLAINMTKIRKKLTYTAEFKKKMEAYSKEWLEVLDIHLCEKL